MTEKVVNFGCRLNTYESQVIANLAAKCGLEDHVFINTCAVTAEAERQARQKIRQLHRQNPKQKIVVTGCGAQINPKQYADMPEVSHVIGNQEKLLQQTYENLKGSHETVVVSDIMQVEETASHLVSGFEGMARAFVQVQNGCNHRCTFCTIPFGRGNSRSVAMGEIVKQVDLLVSKGYKEVVFTGVDITAYGEDLPGKPTFGQMCRRVLALVPSLKRLRLSSLDSVEMDRDLWHLIAHEPRLMPHLHLSLQAGDDMVLKRMKRRHLKADAIRFCQQAKIMRPDVVLGADIIAGFPTETETMFKNTLDTLDQCDITYLHVFPYSKRPGTPAARMPQVQGDVIKQRAKILRDYAENAQKQFFNTLVGAKQQVLVEQTIDGRSFGKTNHFTHVVWEGKSTPGDLVDIKMLRHDGKTMQGELLGRAV